MIDALIRPYINPFLDHMARFLHHCNIPALHLTAYGAGFGVAACLYASAQIYTLAFLCLCLNRLYDGLDGTVARISGKSSNFGGYIDILCDFMIYAGFPLGIAAGLGTLSAYQAAAFVIFSMVMSGVSFLAFAIMAEKQSLKTESQGQKSFFYSFGLLEGTETIVFLLVICAFPAWFEWCCLIFGVLCLMTTVLRTIQAASILK